MIACRAVKLPQSHGSLRFLLQADMTTEYPVDEYGVFDLRLSGFPAPSQTPTKESTTPRKYSPVFDRKPAPQKPRPISPPSVRVGPVASPTLTQRIANKNSPTFDRRPPPPKPRPISPLTVRTAPSSRQLSRLQAKGHQ
mgnify:CR=1 FL=1